MKTALFVLAALAGPALAQQTFDFKLLDKLGTKAKDSTNITLEGPALQLASGFLDDSDKSTKELIKGLKGVHVRSYTYSTKGQYDPADLAPFRAYLTTLKWNKILEDKEKDESTEIYLQAKSGSELGGLAIVAAEPKEVTVVYIVGSLNLSDLSKVAGTLGIPSMSMSHGAGTRASDKKAEFEKKD